MTVIFHDIHQDEVLKTKFYESEIHGTNYNEILYADDTILMTKTDRNGNMIAQNQTGRRQILYETQQRQM